MLLVMARGEAGPCERLPKTNDCQLKTGFLLQQNLSDQSCYFLDELSQLRTVLDKNRLEKLSEYVFKNSVPCLLPEQQQKTSGDIILMRGC
jgi:hypothetical protein